MIIKENKKNQFFLLHKIRTALNSFLKIKIRSISSIFNFKNRIVLVLMTIFVWSFLLTVVVYRKSHTPGFEELSKAFNLKGRDIKNKTSESFKSVFLAPFRWMKANLSDQGIPSFNIDIKFKDMQRLISKREDALDLGRLIKADNDYVTGRIRFND